MKSNKNRSGRFQRTGRFASRRSFNLVELSLAVAVVAVGVVSVFGILPHLLQSSRQAADFSAIALDVQQILEDPKHRGMIAVSNLYDTTMFPTVASPDNQNVQGPSFQANRSMCSWDATNADYSTRNDAVYTNYYANSTPHPILKTVFVTYAWGNINSPSDQNSYTFITETAATENFLSP